MKINKMDRRKFLGVSGACLLGLGVLPAVNALADNRSSKVVSSPDAREGQRWAMVVDMKKCWESGAEDCQDCILACRRAHNIPDIGNTKEEIKWIWTVSYDQAFPERKNEYLQEDLKNKPFVVLCNHCDNPPCVRVCPTRATFKRADGIVMMDYHRCIGCRYCMAACPYGARSFNFKDPRPYIEELNTAYPTREKGVVEKCNFCAERLAEGSPPACVEACKEGALVFGDLKDPGSDVRKILRSKYTIRRNPGLGTNPSIYYVI